MPTLGLNIILSTVFRANVSISKGLGYLTYGETMTCNPNLQPAVKGFLLFGILKIVQINFFGFKKGKSCCV